MRRRAKEVVKSDDKGLEDEVFVVQFMMLGMALNLFWYVIRLNILGGFIAVIFEEVDVRIAEVIVECKR